MFISKAETIARKALGGRECYYCGRNDDDDSMLFRTRTFDGSRNEVVIMPDGAALSMPSYIGGSKERMMAIAEGKELFR